jgi:hypothetical protein
MKCSWTLLKNIPPLRYCGVDLRIQSRCMAYLPEGFSHPRLSRNVPGSLVEQIGGIWNTLQAACMRNSPPETKPLAVSYCPVRQRRNRKSNPWPAICQRFTGYSWIHVLRDGQVRESHNYMKKGVFWVVTPCGSCNNRRFGGTWCLLHQGDKTRRTRNNTSCN